MISSLPGRPLEWNSRASASVYLTLLSDMRPGLSLFRHPRESGGPASKRKLGSRFRGNDEWGYRSTMARADEPTPMMAQYKRLKDEAGEALLFYRMGDFFELF